MKIGNIKEWNKIEFSMLLKLNCTWFRSGYTLRNATQKGKTRVSNSRFSPRPEAVCHF